ncbi:MAG: aldo/keto reductase [Candidatus Latescibacteria bacterium]|jgi:aryl-alcohol dehydrogenase-like predicted oxidoreductase|nr:aldo/keto reductase [Candidatus Latescibacterota bacterium]
MKTRKLGWTDLELSTVGLGTWAIGGGGWQFSWGYQDDKESIAAILHAVEKGVNWIDTAAVYGLGHSEEVVGKALKELPGRPIIATKGCRVWDREGNITGSLKKGSIKKEIEASLKRLDTDVIDLYQIHWPVPEDDIEEGWSAVADAVKEGKIRYAGVSNFNVGHIERIKNIHPVASLQPPYSMIKSDVEMELLGYCVANNIGVVVYSPMQKGLLTGKFTKERAETLSEEDHRSMDPQFHEPELSINMKLVEGLREIAERNGKTAAQLAIAWVLRRHEVTSAIVGTRKPSQIEETVMAGDWMLSEEDVKEIEFLLARRMEELG